MAAFMAALVTALFCAGFVMLAPGIVTTGPVLFGADWVPALGIGLWFMLDGLALIFSLLITGTGALIFLYSIGYMGDHPHFGRFVLFLFLFMLSMLGLVLARDLITLFVFWELTSLTSFLLIGFRHEDPQARRNALQALLVTGAGGLALLAGFILIGIAAGSYDLAEILQGPGLQGHAAYPAILVLVLLGAFTKSAQMPFHFWLPGAMAAPTPVSAFLHSATMVKAGIYLLARLHPVLSGSWEWQGALTLAGASTALFASVMALRQRDLKQALAWTTLMALGVLTLFLAQAGVAALSAAMTFLIVHALYKAALFMVVGAVEHATGSRDATALGGLARQMPKTALAALLAAASMAGLPPFLGWIGKELLYAGVAPGLVMVLLLSNALIFAVAGAVAIRPFFGRKPEGKALAAAHDPSWLLLIGATIPGMLGLVLGLMPGLLQPLITAALRGFGEKTASELHLWEGFGLPLWLSLATFALGLAFFLMAPRLRIRDARPSLADRLWDRFLQGFAAFAGQCTRLIQNGRFSHYLLLSFMTLAAMLAITLAAFLPEMRFALSFSQPMAPVLWLIAAFILGGAALALTTRSRIANIAGLGAVGLGVALIFLVFGAPDVALTQLMAETLSAVLFAIALTRLPGITETRSRRSRLLHGLVAAALGLCVTLILLAILAHPADRSLAEYFEQNAFSLAHGLNIVNVILVDFRAFDTFGELSVVLLASIGAWALLKRRVRR